MGKPKNKARRKERASERAMRLSAGDGERQLEQVSSAALVPPSKPTDPTEADVDFAKEEADLDRQMKELKAKRAKLAGRKKQAVGGKKLGRMRKYAQAATDWAVSAATKFVNSVERANDAVSKLQEYEEKLGIPKDKRQSTGHIESLELLIDAAESVNAARS